MTEQEALDALKAAAVEVDETFARWVLEGEEGVRDDAYLAIEIAEKALVSAGLRYARTLKETHV